MEGAISLTELHSKTCTFLMLGDSNWKIIGTRQYEVRRIRMYAYYNGQLQYSLEQDSLLKQLICNLPLSRIFFFNPFILHQNGQASGTCKTHIWPLFQGKWEFRFGGNTYFVTVHSKGVYSLLMNGEQVAVYKRFRGSHYRVRYVKEMDQRHDTLILFAAFFELYTCLKNQKSMDAEAYVIPWDCYIERARWLPEDDVGKEPFCTWTSWQEKWRARKAAKQRRDSESS